MKNNSPNQGMTFHEHLRFVIELEIARDKMFEFESDITSCYSQRLFKSVPFVTHPIGETIKLCMENKYLGDCSSQQKKWERDLYALGLGYKLYPFLDYSVLSKSKTGDTGLVRYKEDKKPGFTITEHDRAGYLLQSVKDFFHYQSNIFWSAYYPDQEPAKVCIQRFLDIEKLQEKMVKVFSAEYPDQPDHVAEQTYLRDKHPP